MTQLFLTPPSAAAWKDIRNFREFPILAESRLRVRKQLQSSQVNFDALGKVIEQDPALCLHLLVLAVEKRPDCREQISGASSCLSLLGMQELVRLMKQLPVVSANSNEQQGELRRQQLYRRALHCAGMAGELASQWAQHKGNCSASYARWSTMLASAPIWLWLLREDLAQNWLYCLSQKEDLIHALNATFGENHLQDWQALAETLLLPQMAQNCYHPENWLKPNQWQRLRHHDPRDLDNQRQLLHQMQEPYLIVMMANSLAWHWHISPLSAHSQRWLALISHWLGKPQIMLMTNLRQIQLYISQLHHDALSSGLALLLSPVTTQFNYPKIELPSQPDTQSPEITQAEKARTFATPLPDITEPKPQRHPDTQYLKKLTQQLQQEPDSFGDWHYLMRGVLKGICRGVGLSSACIALLNKEKTALKIFYAEGVSEQDRIRRLVIDVHTPNVFRKLLQKPASLLITRDNHEKFMHGLSENVIKQLPQQLVMMSIDAGNKPIGVIFGYNDHGDDGLTPAEYMAFKNLCLTTSQSLAALRNNTGKQRPKAMMANR